MALPATENFAGGAAALSGSWAQRTVSGAATVNRDGSGLGTQSAIDASFDKFAVWTADAFAADQYAQVVVKAVASTAAYAEAMVRSAGNAGTFSGYTFYTDGVNGAGHTELAVFSAGTPTVLCNFSPAAAFATGDVLKMQVVGNVITCYKNGVVLVPSTGGTSVTNSTLASGSAGLGCFWGAGSAPTFDDWEGGNVGVAAVSLPTIPLRWAMKKKPQFDTTIPAVVTPGGTFRR